MAQPGPVEEGFDATAETATVDGRRYLLQYVGQRIQPSLAVDETAHRMANHSFLLSVTMAQWLHSIARGRGQDLPSGGPCPAPL